jgi:fluoride exporter
LYHSLLIFFGAGLGGVFRYWVSTGIHAIASRPFPYGTLVVNISGCLLMGFLFTLTTERYTDTAFSLRPLLLIGFLGGYTTFSSFSIETMMLLESGQWFSGLLNIFLSVMLCLLATSIGILGGRSL